MSAETRAVAFWDCSYDQEELRWTTIEEAVEMWADQFEGVLPETVTVHGFARMEVPSVEWVSRYSLELILEHLDQQDGMCGEDSAEPTPAMQEAALAFAEVIRAEYKVWGCEPIEKRVVIVRDYIPPERADVL